MSWGTRILKLPCNFILKTVQPSMKQVLNRNLLSSLAGSYHQGDQTFKFVPAKTNTAEANVLYNSNWPSPVKFPLWRSQPANLKTSENVPNENPLSVVREIIDPTAGNRPKMEIPLGNISGGDFRLPCNVNQIEKIEPLKNVITIKTKTNIIIIRRKKMKKHKWRKLQKKMKFVFRKIRQKRELKKEMLFQSGLKDILKEGEEFVAEKYLQNKLDTLNWVPPVTRARGRLAPQWVIEQELERERLEKIHAERIAECIKKTGEPK